MAQQRFWKEFCQLKVQLLFVQKLLLEAERKETSVKIFFAVTSSASIGAWVVWKEWAFLWGGIIAASQVLTAIYPHLPYKERQKTYASILRELELLFIDAEHKWQAVADGSLSSRQIDKERNFLIKKKSDVLNKFIPNSVFPFNPKLAEQADKESASYFSYFYPQEENSDAVESLLPPQENSQVKVS